MTGARPDTWMPLYIGDYIADTMHLTTLQHGAYLLLIMAYWRRGGPIPNDDEYLKRVVRYSGNAPWAVLKSALLPYFVNEGGALRHKRIDEEILRASQAYEKHSAAAMRRWCQADARHVQSQPQSHSLTSVREENAPKEQPSGRTGTRLPTDWQPDPEDTAFAEHLGLDSLAVAARFRDYWIAKPGAAGRKSDWAATWRNWCRKDAADPGRSSNGTGKHGAGYDRREAGSVMAAAARVIARQKSGGGV